MSLAVTARLPLGATDKPGIVLIHGAANSGLVWTFWQEELTARGWATYAINLQGHGASSLVDLSRVAMEDYAADVCLFMDQLSVRPVVMGWSMGGLVAMMAATTGHAPACVALAPSTPALQIDPSIELRKGEFGPEEYGITSDDSGNHTLMPDLDVEELTIALASLGKESRFARDQRRRGVIIPGLPCPLLIVTGTLDTAWPKERYDGLWLRPEHLSVEDASHWGLVLSRGAISKCVPAVVAWLEKKTQV